MKRYSRMLVHMAGLVLLSTVALAQQTGQEHLLALKANLAASKAILKQYQWIETTIVSVNGEEKSRKMSRCYYGDDGTLQKIPLTPDEPQKKERGLRGRIAEHKREELTENMKKAASLVKRYNPPDAALIQAAKDAGNVSINPLSANRVRLTISNYLLQGDNFAVVVDTASNRPVEAIISTYMDSPDKSVTLNVQFGTLPSNATYASTIVLQTSAKDLTVTEQNTGYTKAGAW